MMDEEQGKKTIILLPHYLLIPKYLEIAEKEKILFDFYYESIRSFDRIFFNTQQSFGEFVNNKGKTLSGRYAYVILQTKNVLDSFFGHYFILKNGLCNSSIPSLRYCYETLLKNYFYLTLPIGEKDLVKYHTTRPSKVRGSLYTQTSLQTSHNKLYEMLSKKSHAGIVSSSPAYTYSHVMYKDSLEFGIFLLYGHIVFLLECFNRFISEEDRGKIEDFFIGFAKIYDHKFPIFIPDKEAVIPLLKFQTTDLVNPKSVKELKRDEEEYLKNSQSYRV